MTNWFNIWDEDYISLIETAKRNLVSDLSAGYDPNGMSIFRSRMTIAEFEERYENGLERFKTMTDAEVNRWCYFDLKKRGVI